MVYLSSPGAAGFAALFRDGLLEPIPLDGPVGAASALKMAYAGWNKGSQALLMAVRALAMREGVDEALLAEWKDTPAPPSVAEVAKALAS